MNNEPEKKLTTPEKIASVLKLHTFADHPLVKQIAGKTKLPDTYILLGMFSLCCLFLFFTRMGKDFLECTCLWFYPAYRSYKAIKTNSGEEFKYLVYWIVFGAFYSVETIAPKLVYWIPFYEIIRIFV